MSSVYDDTAYSVHNVNKLDENGILLFFCNELVPRTLAKDFLCSLLLRIQLRMLSVQKSVSLFIVAPYKSCVYGDTKLPIQGMLEQ